MGQQWVARWSESLHGQGVLLVTMRDSGVATEGADGLGRVPYGYGGFNQKKQRYGKFDGIYFINLI